MTEAPGASEPDAVIAALLHDAIEDQDVTAEMIASEFGKHVAEIVVKVTDDKSLPKAERKAIQVAHAATLSPGAKLIKLADKISNLRSVATSPPADWPQRQRLEYVEWCRKVVAGLRGTNAMLEKLFDETAIAAGEAVRHDDGDRRALLAS